MVHEKLAGALTLSITEAANRAGTPTRGVVEPTIAAVGGDSGVTIAVAPEVAGMLEP